MSRFDSREYGFWFVRLIDRMGLGWLGGAVAIALVPYLLGLILVAPFGDGGLYLRTPAFYIGLGGVGLVIAASVRGVEILTKGLSELQEVAREPEDFHEYADRQLTTAARNCASIGLLAVFCCGAAVIVAAALHRWHHTGVVSKTHGFQAFPVQWHAPDALVPAGLALAVFAVAVSITLGSSAILLCRNLRFAWKLRSFAYMPFPGRVRLGVRTLVTAYAWVSGTWAVGVALFALFFFSNWSTLNVLGIALLAAAGILTLAVPYNSFRRILDHTHEEMATLLAREVEPGRDGSKLILASPSDFAAVNMAITADPPPVLTRRDAITYSVVQTLALATLFAKDFLQEQVTFLASESSSPPKSDRPS
ncbi:MAG TPA: hypothetical protein VK781_13165 [Solirubrobacteraceae bacterium]|jgi:hypothetical protein|nr:hypothetical protein [Solirubrobacteraceae bacterium]